MCIGEGGQNMSGSSGCPKKNLADTRQREGDGEFKIRRESKISSVISRERRLGVK